MGLSYRALALAGLGRVEQARAQWLLATGVEPLPAVVVRRA
ncbi:MAG TPA: hypothetical protein VLQ78_04290 [Ornithinibacter sp.]|nr:hypothetical protein [Ornithinibacter sp.]